jgi:hypothetical protein
MPESALVTLLLAGRLLAAAPADLSPAITVAPQTLEASPRLVALSGSSVFHAPGERYNVLAYAGRYYSRYRGSWFRSTGPGNAWSLIAPDRVPKAVLAVLPTFATASSLPSAAAIPAR